jgi:hypothetical protein
MQSVHPRRGHERFSAHRSGDLRNGHQRLRHGGCVRAPDRDHRCRARFTASEQALPPELSDAAKRGLIYVVDGASSHSPAGQIARPVEHAVCESGRGNLRSCSTAADRSGAASARTRRPRQRQRRRDRECATGGDGAYRGLGEAAGGPRLRPGPYQPWSR